MGWPSSASWARIWPRRPVTNDSSSSVVDGPRPTVLTTDRQVRRLTVADVGTGLRTVGRLKVPGRFEVRVPAARRDLAAPS